MNTENKIVGIGYNGMPNGCSDDLLPWRRTAESKLDTKYPYGKASAGFILLPVLALGVLHRKQETKTSLSFQSSTGGKGKKIVMNYAIFLFPLFEAVF